MGDHGHVRPEAARGVELRREVVEVQHLGAIGTRSPQWRFPHGREVLGQRGRHGREHHVGDFGAVLVRGMHR